MSQTELIRELQVLTVGRNAVPANGERTAANGKPSGDVGFEVKGVVNAFVGVALRDTADVLTARITIDTVVDTATFDINFDSLGVTSVIAGPSDTPATIAAALVAAAGSTYGSIGTLEVNGDAVVFIGADDDAVVVSAVAGSGGAMTSEVDSTECTWRIWYRLKDDPTWYVVASTERTDVDNAGERFIVAGLERVYVEIVAADGTVRPAFARCEVE